MNTLHPLHPLHHPNGSFALPTRRALRLRPQAAAQITMTQGCAWATLPRLGGDHVLRAGDVLSLQRGDDVVIEAWRCDTASSFSYQLALPAQTAAEPAPSTHTRQALRELRVAGVALTGALATFLGALGADLVRARGLFFFKFWAERAFRAH